MSVILDTSLWIEYLKGKAPTHAKVQQLLLDDEVIGTSAVFGELLYGVRSKTEYATITQLWELLPKLDERELMINAGTLAYDNGYLQKGVGLIDSSIVSLARDNNIKVWTLDKKLKKELGYEFTYD